MDLTWGSSPTSSISVVDSGQCLSFTFQNSLTDSTGYTPLEVLGNVASVMFGNFDEPDLFTVLPAIGWEVLGEATLEVEEWSSAVITVCQMLLG